VFLAYASRFGQALIDRCLYLPEAWAGDGERRAGASVPPDIPFVTKSAIASDLIAAVLDAGASCAFVLADALYGSDAQLRRMLEGRGQPYVLAVRANHHLRFLDGWKLVQTNSATMAGDLPHQDWEAHAAGEGAKGLRLYDWARIGLPWTSPDGFERFPLIRRNRRDPERRAYYLVFAPAGTILPEFAGWRVCSGPSRNASSAPGRSRPRPLRGALLARVAPSYGPGHGDSCLPGAP
jgi:hypothetical protein